MRARIWATSTRSWRVQNPSFERVNVSYEYWEYGVSLEGGGYFNEDDNWTVRHGGLRPWNPDGYYSNHCSEARCRR